MTLEVRTFPVGPLRCNCSILVCPESREALVVDPGDEAPRILAELTSLGAEAVRLVHTHAHFDHCLAAGEVAAATDAEIWLHPDDQWLWENLDVQTGLFLGRPAPCRLPAPTHAATDGARLVFGSREAAVVATPGHTPGSICLFVEAPGEAPLLLAGDTLFRGSVGRTDLWGGAFPELERSIKERLYTLPLETRVVPGHGPTSTIGHEREHNPFVRP